MVKQPEIYQILEAFRQLDQSNQALSGWSPVVALGHAIDKRMQSEPVAGDLAKAL